MLLILNQPTTQFQRTLILIQNKPQKPILQTVLSRKTTQRLKMRIHPNLRALTQLLLPLFRGLTRDSWKDSKLRSMLPEKRSGLPRSRKSMTSPIRLIRSSVSWLRTSMHSMTRLLRMNLKHKRRQRNKKISSRSKPCRTSLARPFHLVS
jgi:hypothetical protein